MKRSPPSLVTRRLNSLLDSEFSNNTSVNAAGASTNTSSLNKSMRFLFQASSFLSTMVVMTITSSLRVSSTIFMRRDPNILSMMEEVILSAVESTMIASNSTSSFVLSLKKSCKCFSQAVSASPASSENSLKSTMDGQFMVITSLTLSKPATVARFFSATILVLSSLPTSMTTLRSSLSSNFKLSSMTMVTSASFTSPSFVFTVGAVSMISRHISSNCGPRSFKSSSHVSMPNIPPAITR
mmetsp:Transcript_7806/g.11733  ORF Transcript_7806/g.11733 Transcript_7806/m.11733 type:complete len:240 (-) Transcript_7806:2807-3526(-)